MSTAESNPGTTTVETPATMTPTPPDSTPEPSKIGADAKFGRAESRPDGATDAGVADASFPEGGVVRAATGAGSPRPLLNAVGRQLMDNAVVILLTGVVIAMMSFNFDSLGDRIDRLDTSLNTRIDDLDTSLNTRIDDTNARIDELSRAVAENGQRLARIEGFLGIGMPAEAAARAPGAALNGAPVPAPEDRAQSGGQPGG